MIYFTADTHFGHTNIIKYCDRPFKTANEMDETIIKNWNAIVQPGDLVYHLGDFAFVKKPNDVDNILRRLNGQVHIVFGGHDKVARRADGFASTSDLKTIHFGDTIFSLCHYAMRIWNKSHYGAYHLYGHSHGSLPDDPNALSCDVGVDCWDFTPVSVDQIKKVMSKKTFVPIDHHRDQNV
jgi:calcineurin-like phosphoesterase family protein